LKEEVKLTKLH